MGILLLRVPSRGCPLRGHIQRVVLRLRVLQQEEVQDQEVLPGQLPVDLPDKLWHGMLKKINADTWTWLTSSIYLSIYLPIYLFTYLSTCIYLSIYSTCIYLSIYLPICLLTFNNIFAHDFLCNHGHPWHLQDCRFYPRI